MKILIITNEENNLREDEEFAEIFRKDGHTVDLKWVDFDGELKDYDVVLRKNCWTEDESVLDYYTEKLNSLYEKIKESGVKYVNFGDDDIISNKSYLLDLYKEYPNQVIPTVKISEIQELEHSLEYVAKTRESMGSGIGQLSGARKALESLNLDKEVYIVQPKIDFVSEIQFYYIGKKLMYAFEYTPSKYPFYPEPTRVNIEEIDTHNAEFFAELSNNEVGCMRIDFLKKKDGTLLFLELETTSPHMCFIDLDEETKTKVLTEYKNNVYNYLIEGME